MNVDELITELLNYHPATTVAPARDNFTATDAEVEDEYGVILRLALPSEDVALNLDGAGGYVDCCVDETEAVPKRFDPYLDESRSNTVLNYAKALELLSSGMGEPYTAVRLELLRVIGWGS